MTIVHARMETAGWPTGHMATAVTSQKEWKVQVLGTLHVGGTRVMS